MLIGRYGTAATVPWVGRWESDQGTQLLRASLVVGARQRQGTVLPGAAMQPRHKMTPRRRCLSIAHGCSAPPGPLQVGRVRQHTWRYGTRRGAGCAVADRQSAPGTEERRRRRDGTVAAVPKGNTAHSGDVPNCIPTYTRGVNALERFETMMESVVEQGFARLLRTRMQPIEVAKRLSRAMEAGRAVAINRVLVPNRFVVTLSAEDFDHFAPIQALLQREIATYLQEYARERKYSLPAPAVVTLSRDEALRPSALRISAQMDDLAQQPDDAVIQPTQVMPAGTVATMAPPTGTLRRAYIEIEGSPCYLDRDVVTIGRGLDNDVVVEDRRVSRHHARIQRSPRGWEIMDLASTNGSFVNGRPVRQHPLAPGDTISLGGLEMKFGMDA
jgi:hypothetical protein